MMAHDLEDWGGVPRPMAITSVPESGGITAAGGGLDGSQCIVYIVGSSLPLTTPPWVLHVKSALSLDQVLLKWGLFI